MRLLHVQSRTFKEFMGSDIPEYAIVSHRWSDEEISYQEFIDGRREGYGWRKIRKACEIALERRHSWIWIDTCKEDNDLLKIQLLLQTSTNICRRLH